LRENKFMVIYENETDITNDKGLLLAVRYAEPKTLQVCVRCELLQMTWMQLIVPQIISLNL